MLGKEHPDALTGVGKAFVLQDQGKYKAAEEINWRALEGHKKAVGKEHPSTLTSVGNLALALSGIVGKRDYRGSENRVVLYKATSSNCETSANTD
jgi:hypothetical protein